MEQGVKFEEFQQWWEQNRHFYNEKDTEDMSTVIEDYKKSKESEEDWG